MDFFIDIINEKEENNYELIMEDIQFIENTVITSLIVINKAQI